MASSEPDPMRYEPQDLPERPRVTVFVPTLNEADHIAQTLDAILAQDYPRELMHIVVVDAMSTDETRTIARDVLSRQSEATWEIVDNADRDLTSATHVAYGRAVGDVFVYVCAHAHIASDYVASVCRALRSIPCDAVGGPYRMVGRSPTGKAIAAAMSCRFGIGASWYRYFTGQEPKDCDPPMASYRMDLIQRTGGLDPTTCGYCEDWEYYRRLRSLGARLYCDPRIRSEFYARDRYRDLYRQMCKYGTAKGWAAKRYGASILRPSHLLPTAWVAFLPVFGALAILGQAWALALLAGGVAAYGLAGAVSAIRACSAWGLPATLTPRVMLAFVIMHASYGVFLLKGVVLGRPRAVERRSREIARNQAECAPKAPPLRGTPGICATQVGEEVD